MAITKRIQLGSSVRRVKPPKPIPGADPLIAYEHIYHELILVAPGGPDNGLPPSQPGLPEVGVPGFPDNSLPGDQPSVDNSLPPFGTGWPGCPGVDNSLPRPPATIDNALPEPPPEVSNPLPEPPPVVNVPDMPSQLPEELPTASPKK